MEEQETKDKIISTLSYLTVGILGFVFLIIGQAQERFIRFHIYQSLLLGILWMLGTRGLHVLFEVLSLPLSPLVPQIEIIFLNIEHVTNQIFSVVIVVVIAYSIMTLWQNKYTHIKWISSQIYRMI